MDVAYPLREKRSKLDPLMWSLRTLVNLPAVDRVFLVGGKPGWVTGVVHVPTIQGDRKFVNIGTNLEALVEHDLSDPFLWMNDDQFIREPWEPVITTRQRTMDEFVESLRYVGSTDHDDYVTGMRSQRDIMADWGYDTETMRCPDNHWPMPVSPDRLRKILARVAIEYPDHHRGHFKAVYAAGLDLYETRDCKAQTPSQLPPDLPVLSTAPSAWLGKAGQMIRHEWTVPSVYEA